MKPSLLILLFGIGLVEVLAAGLFSFRSKTIGPGGASNVTLGDFAHKMTVLLGTKGLLVIFLGFATALGGYEWFVGLHPSTRLLSVLGAGLALCALAGVFDFWRKAERDFPSWAQVIIGGTGILVALSWTFLPTVVFGS